MIVRNSTTLDDARLRRTLFEATALWPVAGLDVRVRYSRGADFSGTCYYQDRRIHINLGRHLSYPYRMDTYIARAVTLPDAWFKPLYSIELADGYQVVLFVFLHEYYHYLIKRARRNTRQKESMCDRFAARVLVDRHAAIIRDPEHGQVRREEWDFQDLDRFIARALSRRPTSRLPTPRPDPPKVGRQLLLFAP